MPRRDAPCPRRLHLGHDRGQRLFQVDRRLDDLEDPGLVVDNETASVLGDPTELVDFLGAPFRVDGAGREDGTLSAALGS